MNKIEELRKKLIQSAKHKIQEKYEGKETHIIKAVNLLEDLDMSSNLLAEQLREWYSTYFPELNEFVQDDSKYAELVHTLGERKSFHEKDVNKIIGDSDNAKNISAKSRNSMGSNIAEEDLAEIKTLALNCSNLKKEREYLAEYVEKNMSKELPNFTEIAGPIIGAKILAKAGSKKRLAFMPASTIQLIGAEKALFMHIKSGVKGPKYGYLFQHPLVKTASRDNKGKLARSIAGKLAIAAKKDYFGNKTSANEMKQELKERSEALEKAKPKEKVREQIPEQKFERKNYETPSWKRERQQRVERRGFENFSERDTRSRPQMGERKPWQKFGDKKDDFRRDPDHSTGRNSGDRMAERSSGGFRKRFDDRADFPRKRDAGVSAYGANKFGDKKKEFTPRSGNRDEPWKQNKFKPGYKPGSGKPHGKPGFGKFAKKKFDKKR